MSIFSKLKKTFQRKARHTAVVADTQSVTREEYIQAEDTIELTNLNTDINRTLHNEGIPHASHHRTDHNYISESHRNTDAYAAEESTIQHKEKRIDKGREEYTRLKKKERKLSSKLNDFIHVPLNKKERKLVLAYDEEKNQRTMAQHKKKGYRDKIENNELEKRITFAENKLVQEKEELEKVTTQYHQTANKGHATHAEFEAQQQALEAHQTTEKGIKGREEKLHQTVQKIQDYPKAEEENTPPYQDKTVYKASIIDNWRKDGLDQPHEEPAKKEFDFSWRYRLPSFLPLFSFKNREYNFLAFMGVLACVFAGVGVIISTAVDYSVMHLTFKDIMKMSAGESFISAFVIFSLGKFLGSFSLQYWLKHQWLSIRPNGIWVFAVVIGIAMIGNALLGGYVISKYSDQTALTQELVMLESSKTANTVQLQQTTSPTLKKSLTADNKKLEQKISVTQNRLAYYSSEAWSTLKSILLALLSALNLIACAFLLVLFFLILEKLLIERDLRKVRKKLRDVKSNFNYDVYFVKVLFPRQMKRLKDKLSEAKKNIETLFSKKNNAGKAPAPNQS